jgi:hypothetical protein
MPAPTHIVFAKTHNGPSNRLEIIFVPASGTADATRQVTDAIKARPGAEPWRYNGIVDVLAIPRSVGRELPTVTTIDLETDSD